MAKFTSIDVQQQLKRDARAAYSVALVQVRDDLFASAGNEGVTLDLAADTLMESPKYRETVAALTPHLVRDSVKQDFKQVFKLTAERGGAQFAYPVPIPEHGSSAFRYVRLEDMTLADADEWRQMVEERLGRISKLLETHDRIVDPLRALLESDPAMTIGEARAVASKAAVA